MKFPNLSEYIMFTHNLLQKHGLTDWKVRWMPRGSVRICGRCKCGEKVVELNKDYAFNTPAHDVIINTCVHEVAHAVAWTRHQARGHCDTWRRVFLSMGGDGQRLNCSKETIMPDMKGRGRANIRAQFSIE